MYDDFPPSACLHPGYSHRWIENLGQIHDLRDIVRCVHLLLHIPFIHLFNQNTKISFENSRMTSNTHSTTTPFNRGLVVSSYQTLVHTTAFTHAEIRWGKTVSHKLEIQ